MILYFLGMSVCISVALAGVVNGRQSLSGLRWGRCLALFLSWPALLLMALYHSFKNEL